jgi:hypothetical protein
MVIGGKPVLRMALELTKERPQNSTLAMIARMAVSGTLGRATGGIGSDAIPQAACGVKRDSAAVAP